MIKKVFLLVVLSFVLLLSACTLAKPEETKATEGDRFVGVYIISEDTDVKLYDLDGWIQDGMEDFEANRINVDIPRLIYPGVFDPEEHRYVFPGLDGYALFVAEARDANDDYPYHTSCIDLQDAHVKYNTVDMGESGVSLLEESYTNYELSGTLYVENVYLKNNYLRLMNVFQKPDGTIYLDGTGDAFACASSFSLEEKSSRTVNGEKVELGTTKVTVTIEEAKEADSGILYWYGETGELLMTQPLDPEQVTELTWQEKADWVIYEETFGEELVRTLYEKGTEEEPVCLSIMTIDEDGIGRIKTVEIQ